MRPHKHISVQRISFNGLEQHLFELMQQTHGFQVASDCWLGAGRNWVPQPCGSWRANRSPQETTRCLERSGEVVLYPVSSGDPSRCPSFTAGNPSFLPLPWHKSGTHHGPG